MSHEKIAFLLQVVQPYKDTPTGANIIDLLLKELQDDLEPIKPAKDAKEKK